jgi:precorrin-2 dehydrogenase/sirohydrochlorin ferrochelatase
MIPLVHDFTGRTVLVFGGGAVGERKARRFAEEARVVVVSPAFTETLRADASVPVTEATHETWEARADGDGNGDAGIELVRDEPSPAAVSKWVERVGPALVVAATDAEEVNEAAAEAARGRGVLVNRTDRAGGRDAGSVVVPATVDDGPVSVAITTGGASPALSKYLRERIEAELADAGAMAELTRELRAELKASDRSVAARREAVRRVVRSSRVWKALHTGTSNPRRVAEDVIRTEMTGCTDPAETDPEGDR